MINIIGIISVSKCVLLIVLILSLIYECAVDAYGAPAYTVPRYKRHPAGSNCIFIERGNMPPYYKCKGCKIEEAVACIEDLRHNKSANVVKGCDMNKLMSNTETQCCPRLYYDALRRRDDLAIHTAAFPMTLNCMEAVGCSKELIYGEILNECKALCDGHFLDTRPGLEDKSLCNAPFNAAGKSILVNSLTVIALSLFGSLLANSF